MEALREHMENSVTTEIRTKNLPNATHRYISLLGRNVTNCSHIISWDKRWEGYGMSGVLRISFILRPAGSTISTVLAPIMLAAIVTCLLHVARSRAQYGPAATRIQLLSGPFPRGSEPQSLHDNRKVE
jgi:hypothetical protein